MIEGMEDIVVTVTGYTGCKRTKLIKLISFAGANYVGKLSKSNTHLICWKFTGEKYQFAKKFGILIVNHQWLEDCIKEGRRIPESPYTIRSGHEVGFNIPNLSAVSETAGLLSENKQLLNRPSIHDYLDVVNLDSDEIENDWDTDPLLNENSSPTPTKREAPQQRFKKKLNKEPLRKDRLAKMNTNRAAHEPQTPAVDGFQCEISDYSPKGASKQRRSNSDKSIRLGSEHAEPSHRNRRLVKKNAETCMPEIAAIDVEQQNKRLGSEYAEPSHRNRRLVKTNAETCMPEIAVIDVEQQSKMHEDVIDCTVASNISNDSTDLNIANMSQGVETVSSAHHERTDEINYRNDLEPVVEMSLHDDDALNAEGGNMKENNPDVSSLKADECTRNQTAVNESDPSCVICWTKFCTTRGVLPCGHRFCFSCIQSWADRMASERKACTCPLCKAEFTTITKVDDAASLDQKIYSQTIPCPSSTQDIFLVLEGTSDVEMTHASVCCQCQNRDPADLLLYCQYCHRGCIHEFCLDPPLFPWTCFHCRDRRYFFRNW